MVADHIRNEYRRTDFLDWLVVFGIICVLGGQIVAILFEDAVGTVQPAVGIDVYDFADMAISDFQGDARDDILAVYYPERLRSEIVPKSLIPDPGGSERVDTPDVLQPVGGQDGKSAA